MYESMMHLTSLASLICSHRLINYSLTWITTFPILQLVNRDPKLSKNLSIPWKILILEPILPCFRWPSISFAKSPKRSMYEPSMNPCICTSLPTKFSKFLTPSLSVQTCTNLMTFAIEKTDKHRHMHALCIYKIFSHICFFMHVNFRHAYTIIINLIWINDTIYLIVLRYHATKRDLCMLVDMVENSLKHSTANIVKVYINSIWEIPVNCKEKTFESSYIPRYDSQNHTVITCSEQHQNLSLCDSWMHHHIQIPPLWALPKNHNLSTIETKC